MSEEQQINDQDKIISMFESIKTYRDKVWLWQASNKSSKRIIQFAVVKSIDHLKKQIMLATYKSKKFHFIRQSSIYLLSKDHLIATKLDLKTYDNDYLTFSFPPTLKIVENDIFHRLQLIELADDQKFWAKRCAPRTRLEDEQLACLARPDGSSEFLNIYDVSSGGISIIVEDPGQFQIGEKIFLVSISGKNFKSKITGEIRNISYLQQQGDAFKVGIKLDLPELKFS